MFDIALNLTYYEERKDVKSVARNMIAETLKAKRHEAGLSVHQVADQLGKYGITLSIKTLYNYETGFRQPDADTLMALCEIYGITNILSTFGYKKGEPADVNADELTENERIFMSLPPDLRQEALRYMRYLAEREDKQ